MIAEHMEPELAKDNPPAPQDTASEPTDNLPAPPDAATAPKDSALHA